MNFFFLWIAVTISLSSALNDRVEYDFRCEEEGIFQFEDGYEYACVQTPDTLVKIRTTSFNSTLQAATCLKPGPTCANCQTLRMCIDDGSENWYKIADYTCPADQVCSLEDGRCVSGKNCSLRPFACQNNGVFPDPKDCSTYYVCLTGKTMTVQCPPGYGYQVQALTCVAIASCTKVPLCTAEFQNGAVGDGSIFYVCTYNPTDGTLAPDQFSCPQGKKYSPSYYKCL